MTGGRLIETSGRVVGPYGDRVDVRVVNPRLYGGADDELLVTAWDEDREVAACVLLTPATARALAALLTEAAGECDET